MGLIAETKVKCWAILGSPIDECKVRVGRYRGEDDIRRFQINNKRGKKYRGGRETTEVNSHNSRMTMTR
jgi:hypothetical protein